jgi:hypothetical protein
MPVFDWDEKHLPPTPMPTPGMVEGKLTPYPGEVGKFAVRFIGENGAVYARCEVEIVAGPAAVACEHTEPSGQKNTRVAIGTAPAGMLVPVWLEEGAGPAE